MMLTTPDAVKDVPVPWSGDERPVLAIDVGATWTRAAVVDHAARLFGRRAQRTPFDGGQRELGEAVAGLAELALTAARAEGAPAPAAVGVAAIGPLDARRGTLLGPPNVGAGYRGLDLADPLARLGLPLFLERDTNVAALGEHAFGAARETDDFVYLTVSTGLGGAIMAGGRLLFGATGVAGELGHLPVTLDGAVCGCGGIGHLEAYSSGTGIARAGREAGLGGADPEALTAADVAGAARAGDARAAAVMDRARRAFAAALVGIVNAFNPALIVVGGGVARGEGEDLLAPARQAIADQALGPAAAAVRVCPAALGDDVGLIGCLPLVGGGGRPVAREVS